MASFANITRQSAVDVYIVAIAVVRFIKSLLEHSYTVAHAVEFTVRTAGNPSL